MPRRNARALPPDPLWFKDAVIYEVHPRAFFDSDGNGMGDFRGLAAKLDYLSALGVTAVWVLPFFPSPLRDDGYDTADYTSVHPTYGTMGDFKHFLREAHARGIRVITELVLNHTSDQHPWFQRARRAKPGSRRRDFYVWSDDPTRYKDARIIFQDFETSNWTWDPVAKAYYWHRFYSHQPDLNFENPQVGKAMFKVIDFWLELGVDGIRLDAVPYLYEQEGTNCENLPQTYEFLRRLRAHVDEKFQDRMLLAEANQWPEDAVAYFGDGDMCHMAFHFPIMPRLYMALRMEDRHPILDILEQTPDIPESCQWALFLRNHDELTLEMVTDEERDYMYRAFAVDPRMRINLGIRRRLSPLMGNNRRTIELLNALLLSLPGTPVLYYGDEIGMGDNIYLGDRNAVRTPMQWSSDRNAGFSRANPQQLYLPVTIDPEYHCEAINVEAQEDNPHSLLWWMRRILAQRRRFTAFGRGGTHFLTPSNHKILAFVRTHGSQRVLVVANLSRYVQYAEVDLADFAGLVPVEVFGQTEFPPIGQQPYVLTMGPHSFYWFSLEPPADMAGAAAGDGDVPVLETDLTLDQALDGASVTDNGPGHMLADMLSRYMAHRPWFLARGRKIKSSHVRETLRVSSAARPTFVCLVEVNFVGGDSELYALPLALADPDRAASLTREAPWACVARLRSSADGAEAVIMDALAMPEACAALLDAMPRRSTAEGERGRMSASRTRVYRQVVGEAAEPATPTAHEESSNTVVFFGQSFVMKFFRRVEGEISPELEMGRFLTERGFPHAPKLAGAIEYRRERGPRPMTLALLQTFVPNQGTAWRVARDSLDRIFENALAEGVIAPAEAMPAAHLLDKVESVPPQAVLERMGPSLENAQNLGQRIGELHAILASEDTDPAFAPEPFTKLYRRSLYQAMRSQMGRTLDRLRPDWPRPAGDLPETTRHMADWALDNQGALREFFSPLKERAFSGKRIRVHGHLHLGHALVTDQDHFLVDFEGDPSRPIGERRIKRSPLRDAASLLGSLHRVAYTALHAAAPVCGALIILHTLANLGAMVRSGNREAGHE